MEKRFITIDGTECPVLNASQRAGAIERRADGIWQNIKVFCGVTGISTGEIIDALVAHQVAYERAQSEADSQL